jgi:hypothetical protein
MTDTPTKQPSPALAKFVATLKKKMQIRKDILDNRYVAMDDAPETDADRVARIMEDPNAWRKL